MKKTILLMLLSAGCGGRTAVLDEEADAFPDVWETGDTKSTGDKGSKVTPGSSMGGSRAQSSSASGGSSFRPNTAATGGWRSYSSLPPPNGGTTFTSATTSSSAPRPTEVTAVAAGLGHTCAVVSGKAYCWGNNSEGQLGTLSHVSTNAPEPVYGLETYVTSISCGAMHSCAVMSGGALCWGSDINGQIGNGTRGSSVQPLPVYGLSTGVSAVAAGGVHSCAIVSGTVLCWGQNVRGTLGVGIFDTSRSVPTQVVNLPSRATAIAVGNEHSCAIVDGGVYCWGNNSEGQLGDGTNADSPIPVKVKALGKDIEVLSAGESHTCAVGDGKAYCWGSNRDGQLGNTDTALSSTTPVIVALQTGYVTDVAAGQSHTCATSRTNAYCWGSNSMGQLGTGNYADSDVALFVPGHSMPVKAITLGGGHSCALFEDGLRCWGRNLRGQLGDGTNVDRPFSDKVMLP